MAAISITAASVAYASGPVDPDQVAGEAFIAGAFVYKRASDSKWLKAQADGTAEEAGSVDTGMALFTADAAGARGSIAKDGAIVTINAVAIAGGVYTLDDTAGSIGLAADRNSTDKVTVVALGRSTTSLKIARIYDAAAIIA